MRKLFGLAMLALVGCGVPQAEFDEVVKERDGLKEEVAKLKGQLADAKKARVPDRNRRPTPKAPPAEKIDKWLKEADITRESKLQAVFDTNHGKITCDLHADKAPLTVANFVGLAEGNKEWTDPKSKEKVKKPFYNGLVFHRIIKNFMIQGGDPMGTGRGGPGYRFEDEVDNGLSFDKPGLLAMANAGPGTNGSQFFITDSTPAHLNGKHTIFGTCDMPTVKKIINVPVNRSKPVEPVVMNTVSIVRN